MATPEERNARDTLERLKDKVEALIGQMENTLVTIPISTSALQKRIQSTETSQSTTSSTSTTSSNRLVELVDLVLLHVYATEVPTVASPID